MGHDATSDDSSQGGITPPLHPQVVSKRKVWFCTWAAEHCGNWAQSNGLRLCQKHRRQHDEEEQRLFAASCLAHISNNDQLRDKVGHAENGNANVQQQQKRDCICQDAALLNKYSDGAALTDEEKKRVRRLRKNAQQRKRRRKDSALLNKYYEDALPVTDEEEKRVLRLDTAQKKSIGSSTIATQELHGMKNTIAGERYFYTRDGRIVLHLF